MSPYHQSNHQAPDNVQHTCTRAFTRAATRKQPNRHRERHTEIKGPVVERFRSPIRIPVEKNAWLIKNRWRNSDAAALSSICKQESQTSTDRLSSLIIPRLPLVIIVNPSQQSSHSELTVSHKHCQHQSQLPIHRKTWRLCQTSVILSRNRWQACRSVSFLSKSSYISDTLHFAWLKKALNSLQQVSTHTL